MADKKVSSLSTLTFPTQDDLLLVIDDPGNTSIGKKITVANFLNNLSFITATSESREALKMVMSANNSHVGNTVQAATIRVQKNGNFTGNNQFGLVCESLLQASGANVTGTHAAAWFNVDVGQSANSGNAYGVIVDTGKANSGWTRAVAPVAFIAMGDDSPGTQPTQYLFDVGRPTKNVSSNTSTGNSSVVLTKANTTTITHKLKIRVNGTDYWVGLTTAF
jgi:hypothetical protein